MVTIVTSALLPQSDVKRQDGRHARRVMAELDKTAAQR